MTDDGFYAATTSEERIRTWFDVPSPPLIGMPTGARSGVWVLDVDRKNGIDGADALDQLIASNGELPDTPVSMTASGGMHYWFRFPDGCKVRNSTSKLGAGLDVRGEGGYVIVPPSCANGHSYEWEASSPPELVEAPAWLVTMASPRPPRERKPHRVPTERDRALADQALASIVYVVTDGRDTWVEIGMAYKAAGGDVDTFEAWSAEQPGYDADKFEREWDSWDPVGGVTAGTLYYHARRFGWDFPRGPASAERGALPLEEMGLEPVANKDGEFIGWLASLSNVAAILELHETWFRRLRYNELASRMELWTEDKCAEVTDVTVHEMRVWLDTGVRWARGKPARAVVFDAVELVCRRHAYHPVADYFSTLQWDGRERLPFWLEDVCSVPRSQYTMTVACAVLIGAVARVYEPGCKLDTMPVLVGPQGAMKSTLCAILAGLEWHVDTPAPIGSKDAYQVLAGAWCYEFAELAAMHGKDVERLKAFFSSARDTYRPAYGRMVVDHPRRCWFIATTNDEEFLHDSTGARRFWPVRVESVDIDALKAIRNQLWAEAVARYRLGEPWHLEGDVVDDARQVADEHYAIDPWEEPIREYVEGLEKVLPSAIYGAIGIPTEKLSKADAMRVTRILVDRLGFRKGAIRLDGAVRRGFQRLPKEGDSPFGEEDGQ